MMSCQLTSFQKSSSNLPKVSNPNPSAKTDEGGRRPNAIEVEGPEAHPARPPTPMDVDKTDVNDISSSQDEPQVLQDHSFALNKNDIAPKISEINPKGQATELHRSEADNDASASATGDSATVVGVASPSTIATVASPSTVTTIDSPSTVASVAPKAFSLEKDAKGAPDFLTPAVIEYFRNVSPHPLWHTLVDHYLNFEKAQNPTGVSLDSEFFYFPLTLHYRNFPQKVVLPKSLCGSSGTSTRNMNL